LEGDEAHAVDDAVLDTAVLDETAGFDRAGTPLLVGRFAL
jgi:hypothetical protein